MGMCQTCNNDVADDQMENHSANCAPAAPVAEEAAPEAPVEAAPEAEAPTEGGEEAAPETLAAE